MYNLTKILFVENIYLCIVNGMNNKECPQTKKEFA